MREWSTITINNHPIPPFPSIPYQAPVRKYLTISDVSCPVFSWLKGVFWWNLSQIWPDFWLAIQCYLVVGYIMWFTRDCCNPEEVAFSFWTKQNWRLSFHCTSNSIRIQYLLTHHHGKVHRNILLGIATRFRPMFKTPLFPSLLTPYPIITP